jgi:hypothetical protein
MRSTARARTSATLIETIAVLIAKIAVVPIDWR